MRYQTLLETSSLKYPTADGSYLQIESKVAVEIELDFAFRDPDDSFPSDAIVTNCYLADADGNVWLIKSRVTSEIFVEHMMDCSHPSDAGWFKDLPSKLVNNLSGNPLLKDIRFCGDDSCYRRLLVSHC